MIPLRLHIKNFLSYAEPQDISFEPHALICLSGKNGHGKSSLLDALTWALWGHARKASGVAKADEGLLHLGQTHMMVILDFLCNGVQYRVKREFTLAAKKGQSNLEFGILESDTGSFKALTDKTIRTTQDKIIHTIGLDYEGFVNSAFIRQGQSHEFSKKSPKERKEVLASLLGLDHFERVRKLANDQSKEALTLQEQAQQAIKAFEEELKEKPLVQERLTHVEHALQKALTLEEDIKKDYELYRTRLTQAQLHKMEAEKMQFKQDHLAKLLEEETKNIREQANTWRTVLRRQRAEVGSVSLDQEYERVQEQLSSLRIRGAQKLKTSEALLIKKEALRSHTQQRFDAHKQELESLDRTIHSAELAFKAAQLRHQELTQQSMLKTKELEEVTAQIVALKQQAQPLNEALIRDQEKHLEKRKSYYHAFISRANSLKTTLSNIIQKKLLITSSEQAVCPLCEQVTDRDQLTHKFSKEEALRTHQLSRLSQVCSALKDALIQEHSTLESLKKNREQQQMLSVQLIELEKNAQKSLKEGELLSKELASAYELIIASTTHHKELAAQRTLMIEAFEKQSLDEITATLQADITHLETATAQLYDDPDTEKHLNAQLSFLHEKRSQQAAFLKELALQGERKRTIREKCTYAQALKKELKELQLSSPAVISHDDEQLIMQEAQLKESLAHLTLEKEQLIHQKGSLETRLEAFTHKERALTQYTKVMKEHTEKYDEYSAIASAFSKDGIQALLIEEALPEIEEEANILLSRLTENQAHISIDSLRDTKSGKTKETLDIKISDAVGVRPYEMFSGGEAFRIDFALRIALAKLLARRAGTALQTLIIDEGFGSQDEDGLAYIMQAIHMIRDDFEKVIIVSHLPSLKEQFPVHFEVQKTPQGSVVSVVEHC